MFTFLDSPITNFSGQSKTNKDSRAVIIFTPAGHYSLFDYWKRFVVEGLYPWAWNHSWSLPFWDAHKPSKCSPVATPPFPSWPAPSVPWSPRPPFSRDGGSQEGEVDIFKWWHCCICWQECCCWAEWPELWCNCEISEVPDSHFRH